MVSNRDWTATDEVAERIAVLRGQAERHREMARESRGAAAESDAKAEHSDRLADEYAALLPSG